MRRRIEALADRVEEFVSEDAHDALVIRGEGEASGGVSAALEIVEARGSIDLFLRFFEPFTDTRSFCALAVSRIETFLAEVKLAPLAEACRDAAVVPVERLARALLHLAREVRTLGDVRVALFACPASVADRDAFLETVLPLFRASRRSDPPLRIAALEPSPSGALREALRLAAIPTLETAIDLSPEGIRDGLAEDAMDPTADPRVRAGAAMAVAMGDAAAGRHGEALAALSTLADHHHARGEAPERALAFVVAGLVLARSGELDEGRRRVAQGIAIAVEAKAVPVVLSGAMGAGSLAMKASDPEDAERHFDLAARLYARVGLASGVAQALIERGAAQVALERWAEARAAWICAAEAAKRARDTSLERRALEPIVELYRRARMPNERAEIEARLASLPAPRACAHAPHEHEA